MKNLKKIGFFNALILPALLVVGYYLGAANIFLIQGFVFVLVPLVDYIIRTDKSNLPTQEVM